MPGDFRLGPWLVQPSLNSISRDGKTIRLEPRVVEVASYLAQHPGETVSKKQLIRSVWGDTFVTDDVLTRCISELRKALEDDPKEPRVIETIPKRGYRLLLAVEGQPRSSEWAKRHKYRSAIIVAAGIIVVATLAYFSHARFRSQPKQVTPITMAVLPFENLSGDPQQEYFSDGLTEEIINQLGRLEPNHLRVIARTSIVRYKGGTRSIADIGRELRANYILEGSVRKESGRVRISAQLIEVGDQSQVWTATLERDLAHILQVQTDVAQGVAEQVQIKLTPERRARMASIRPVDVEAYDFYLKGRFYWNRNSNADIKKCIEYFEQAIAKDPNYALAYAALSEAYNVAAYRDLIPAQDGDRKAEAAALHALQLDDGLGEAHIALAGLYSDFEHWEKATAEFKRGLELDPNSVTGRIWYAGTLSDLGRHDEAVRETQLALKIDPLSLRANRDAGEKLYAARRYDEAIAQFKRTLELYPQDFPTYHDLWNAYLSKGMYDEAATSLFKCLELGATPGREKDQELLAYKTTYRDRGITGLLRLRAQLLEQKWHMQRWQVACYDARLGEKDQAFTRLYKIFERRSVLPGHVTDPCLDNLHSDPRYEELLSSINLQREGQF